MNTPVVVIRSTFLKPRVLKVLNSAVVRFGDRPISTTTIQTMAMKPGTPIPGLDIFKEKDAPVALPREEYPEWIDTLAQPMVSLAKLRKMPLEEASDKEVRRYLKLVRKMKIKEQNAAAKAVK